MLKATSSIVNVSQITGVLPVANGGTGVTTSTGTGSTVLSAAPTLSGNVTLSTGNLIVASGQGIDFSATPGTGTSELFDDYEEGTWTATIGCTGNATTTTTKTGFYTKIGRQVTVSVRNLNDIDTTGLSGFLTVSLPFVCITADVSFLGTAIWDSLIYPGGVTFVLPSAANGGSSMSLVTGGSGTGDSLLSASALTSGTTDLAVATLTYFTA